MPFNLLDIQARGLDLVRRVDDFLPYPRVTASVVGALGLFYTIRKASSLLFSRSSNWDWTKEIVLVTGGSNGLGELIVRKLAKKGIKVIAVDLLPPKSPFPKNVTFHRLDVTSPSDIQRVAHAIRKAVGKPTVLINNAGVAAFKPMLEETDQEIQRTFDVNIVAHFWLAREFLPHMIDQNHGHVVTVASMASYVTVASNVDYSCSKAAALSFHEGLRQELKHTYKADRVRTSIVHPFWVRTAMLEKVLKRGAFRDPVLESDDVAEAIVGVVLKGESRQLFMPGYGSLASGLRGFPTWFQDAFRGARANVITADLAARRE